LFRYLLDRIIHGEAHLYHAIFVQRQSYHGDYACILGRVTISGGDGMDSYSSTYYQASVGHVATSKRRWEVSERGHWKQLQELTEL
jgi:hypothetical protein